MLCHIREEPICSLSPELALSADVLQSHAVTHSAFLPCSSLALCLLLSAADLWEQPSKTDSCFFTDHGGVSCYPRAGEKRSEGPREHGTDVLVCLCLHWRLAPKEDGCWSSHQILNTSARHFDLLSALLPGRHEICASHAQRHVEELPAATDAINVKGRTAHQSTAKQQILTDGLSSLDEEHRVWRLERKTQQGCVLFGKRLRPYEQDLWEEVG